MTYTVIHIIHLFSAFIYGGFLIVDNLFFAKMKKDLGNEEYGRIREVFMSHVRKVVPWALIVAVLSGLYLISQVFGEVDPQSGLSTFQIILLCKAFLGVWLGIRGASQKFLKIDPLVFKSHKLPFYFLIAIIVLAQLLEI
ncbi:MAG: hypothetical protein OIF32_08705 [Campylobacterales bacterium]|nr:hypothetical protein [Campylobacterales bacterium]